MIKNDSYSQVLIIIINMVKVKNNSWRRKHNKILKFTDDIVIEDYILETRGH